VRSPALDRGEQDVEVALLRPVNAALAQLGCALCAGGFTKEIVNSVSGEILLD
jgi:hypothetical protein